MGGYGVYVWGSFIACSVAICMEGVLLAHARRQTMRQIARASMLANLARSQVAGLQVADQHKASQQEGAQ
ncbi:heme exporter protein CcmD [Chitinibacter sp. GC72]|uniref:heme exporter protein CcmD n=1 Tax=Chitinibacter sp. GC72 TaxID=1526917 RepID=UPI002105C773|nr:heme exporter protein CcmD [Chitinibacter sp. GC72]